ncbi:MAG TPA: hypothetical protein VE871_07005 [Longimicrobium sp.]|nr:hypothetical protein [Longimicrobium sp.]
MRLSKLGHLALALVLAGGAAACDEGNDTDPPLSAPDNVAATYNGTNAVVAWSASTGAQSYDVQRSNVTRGTAMAAIATGITATTYSDTVTPGNTYSYVVIARRTGEQSGSSIPANLVVGLKQANLTPIAANGTRTLNKDTTYVLSGTVTVDSGAVLTIPAGTRLVGDTIARPSSLVIRRGARIIANGTAAEPIVFTSQKPAGRRARGDWGGLVINGRSNCNFTNPCSGEGSSGTYGGTLTADSSGVLRYVRIEYAGFEVSPNNELNGLTLNGVGSKTVIENVQVHFGNDDGIEWFGGTVNVKWALVTGADDDQFDYSTGWQGKGQFWIAQTDTTRGDKGFEVDNNETTFTAQPWTDPVIYNVTLIGRSGRGAANLTAAGLHLRRGTRGDVFNAIITGFNSALDVDDQVTADQCASGDLRVSNSIVFANTNVDDPDGDTFEAGCRGAAGWSLTAAASNPLNAAATNLDAPNFTPASAAAVAGAAAVPTGDAFFSAVDYIGAVAPTGTPWYQGWTTFARN